MSHLSVLPQQVVPLGVEPPIIIAAGEENSFSILVEPQQGQVSRLAWLWLF